MRKISNFLAKNNISESEFQNLDNSTSDLQSQINTKASISALDSKIDGTSNVKRYIAKVHIIFAGTDSVIAVTDLLENSFGCVPVFSWDPINEYLKATFPAPVINANSFFLPVCGLDSNDNSFVCVGFER